MREINVKSSFKKDLKKVSKQQHFKNDLLKKLISDIASGKKLEDKYVDHAMASNSEFSGKRNFHLSGNVVVLYELTPEQVILHRIGSHQDLGLTENYE